MAPPFDEFWEALGVESEVPTRLIEQGHGSVFGAESYRPSPGVMPGWMKLPDEALSYHVAHELTHVVLRRRGYPTTALGTRYDENSDEARVGGDLKDMVDHPALELLLGQFPFDRQHIQRHLFEGAHRGVMESPVPEQGSLWWATWVCRFCELHFLLPYGDWLTLEEVYNRRCPEIANKGRDLMGIMAEEGYGSPTEALRAMVRCRDALGLGEGERCMVRDPISGKSY